MAELQIIRIPPAYVKKKKNLLLKVERLTPKNKKKKKSHFV